MSVESGRSDEVESVVNTTENCTPVSNTAEERDSDDCRSETIEKNLDETREHKVLSQSPKNVVHETIDRSSIPSTPLDVTNASTEVPIAPSEVSTASTEVPHIHTEVEKIYKDVQKSRSRS
ncbi:hypothetical protein EVAR_71411_1, partial [Eumeta japonica]